MPADAVNLKCGRIIFSSLMLAGLAAAPAHAQTPSPLAEWQYSPGHVLESMFVDQYPKWSKTFGLSTEVLPKYEGSQAYTTQFGPTFDIRYYDIAFASTGEGFGVNLLHGKGYRAGVALSYDLGRDQDDDGKLVGLGDISPAPEAKLFAEYVVFPVVLRLDARHAFGGHGGWTGDVSAYLPVTGSKTFFVFVGPSLTFANTNDLRHTFGISPQQSQRSGYPTFEASGGLRSASFGASAGWFFSKHWLLDATAAAEQLLGEAARSPLTQEQGQYALSLTLAYHY